MLKKIVEVVPNIDKETLLNDLVPPSIFIESNFHNYFPDKNYMYQQTALAETKKFTEQITVDSKRSFSGKSFFGKIKLKSKKGRGLYLDGGFGVGKTHLLSAIYHSFAGEKIFVTFVELTNLVGMLGFNTALADLSKYKLLCIDEFELDDPGDTTLVSRLLSLLNEKGVNLAVTSNTLPDKLGEDRFSAVDFQREIKGLAKIFTVLPIDGPDYRKRDFTKITAPIVDNKFLLDKLAVYSAAYCDDFSTILAFLSTLHPAKYRYLLEGMQAVGWLEVTPLVDQIQALRLVSFIDRLYDANVRVYYTGKPLDSIFPEEMLNGGYKKKYFRAISRLNSLTSAGS